MQVYRRIPKTSRSRFSWIMSSRKLRQSLVEYRKNNFFIVSYIDILDNFAVYLFPTIARIPKFSVFYGSQFLANNKYFVWSMNESISFL